MRNVCYWNMNSLVDRMGNKKFAAGFALGVAVGIGASVVGITKIPEVKKTCNNYISGKAKNAAYDFIKDGAKRIVDADLEDNFPKPEIAHVPATSFLEYDKNGVYLYFEKKEDAQAFLNGLKIIANTKGNVTFEEVAIRVADCAPYKKYNAVVYGWNRLDDISIHRSWHNHKVMYGFTLPKTTKITRGLYDVHD